MNSGAAGTAAFTIIAFFLLIPPLSWHAKSRNIPAILLVTWLMLVNLIGFINTMIWSGDDFDTVYDGQGWCDVTTKIEAASSLGKLCAIACLSMNLYFILCAKNPSFIDNKNWKKVWIDLTICLLTPVLIMIFIYITQARRYAIVRYQGCITVFSSTNATIGLYLVWPLIWSFVALFFATLTLYKYFQKRKDVKDILKCTNSGLNLKRFARLLIFSILIVFVMTPLSIYYFAQKVSFTQYPFHWEEVHSPEWGDIYFADFGFFSVIDRLVNSSISIVAFLLFGLGTDALKMYRSFLRMSPKESGEPLSKETTYIHNGTPTKLISNKSQFSERTNYSQPTVLDEFGGAMQELGIVKEGSADLESGKSGRAMKQNSSKKPDSVGVPEIEDSSLNGDFLYKYEVKQKK
ncbi:STE3 [Candida margitis]|uniref:STE3 n=1 Tax=Candida margitis TaxID=1775924 RepID=UPI002225C5CB|nr:STE3 [Candida margitis]KAI5969142.1 STE3 [Candida margitis]